MADYDFTSWSCSKIERFLEGKRVEWFVDNVSLSELQLLKRKLYGCNKTVYARMQRFFGLAEQKIARR